MKQGRWWGGATLLVRPVQPTKTMANMARGLKLTLTSKVVDVTITGLSPT